MSDIFLAFIALCVQTWIVIVTGFDENFVHQLFEGEPLPQEYPDKFTRVFIKYNFNTPTCTQLNQGRRILSPANSTAIRSNILNAVAGDLLSDINSHSVPVVNEHRNKLSVEDEDSDLKMSFVYNQKHSLDSMTLNRPIPTDTEDPVPFETMLERLQKLPCVEAVGLQPKIHIISAKPSENVRAASKPSPKETKIPATIGHIPKEPVYTYPNDPFHNQQWWYLSRGEAKEHYPAFGGDFVLPNLQEVHQIWNGNNSNYKIGVVDTGLDIFHPDILENGIVEDFDDFRGTDSQFYFNRAEADGYDLDSGNLDTCFDESDTDNNGYTDDCFGVSFLGWSVPLDFAGHGTHVSGLIAANTNNGKHVASACPHCKVVPIMPLFPLEALLYAIANQIPVMNWSFGFYRDALYCKTGNFCNAIQFYLFLLEWLIQEYKNEVNGIIVVAAGNEPTDLDDCLGLTPDDPIVCRKSHFFYGYPCQLSVKYDNVICVGASDHFGKVAKFSTFGQESVTVFAPGVDMLSLGVSYFGETQANYQGTSMASPVVAGIVGLIRSRYPALTVAQINKIMQVSCQKTKQLQTKSVCGGVIDAVKAMAHASVCNQVPTQCGMPLSPGADEESHESVISWFCQKAASFGHSYVPFCHT